MQGLIDIGKVLAGGAGTADHGETVEGLVPVEGIEGDIQAHYDAHIRPHCARFEQSRQEAFIETARRKPKGQLATVAIAIVAIALCFVVPADSDGDSPIPAILMFGVFGAIAVWVWVQWPKHLYKASIKQEIFPHVFSFFGSDYHYDAEASGISVAELKPSGIIPSYNTNGDSNEDLVRGSYQGVSLELFESSLVRGSGKNRTTVFRGLFISLGMNKHFGGHTIVKRDRGKLGNFFADKSTKLENVKLEDPRFEEQFEVYSSDQVEARYLLTPAFMERLMHLEDIISGGKKRDDAKKRKKGIQVAFYDDRLLLMIPSGKHRFEVRNIDEPVTFYDDINTIMKEMADIFGIIEHLKLQEQTRL